MTHGLDVPDRLLMLTARTSRTAIGRYEELEFAHIGIVSSADDTTVCGNAAENQSFGGETSEQRFQGTLIKSGMHRFKNEVVFRIRLKHGDKLPAPRLGTQAV